MKLVLSQKVIETLPVGTHYDTKLPGLVLYVTEHSKRWGVYKWSAATQRPVRVAIGAWPAYGVEHARREAQEVIYKLGRKTSDDAPKPARDTLGDLADRYELALKATGAKDPAHNSWIIDKAAPEWRKRAAAGITRQEVEDKHAEISATRGQHAAARFVKSLRAVYRHADMPCPGARVRTAAVKPRARIGSKDEMAAIRAELDKAGEPWRDYFLLSILTGARRANVSGMRFEDVKDGVWTIPADKAKMGDAIVLPLVDEAAEIIEKRRQVYKSGFVFPGTTKAGHLTHTWEKWDAIRRAAGAPDLTQHDLRRTLISRLAEAGVHPSVAAALAGHRDVNTTLRVYTVVNEAQKREALAKISSPSQP